MSRFSLQPTEERVALRIIKHEPQSISGLFVPAPSTRPNRGEVMATGPRVAESGVTVAVGQRVVFQPGSGTPFQVGGDEVLILSAHDLLAVLP